MPHEYPCEARGTAIMETVEMWEHDGEGGRIPAICDGVRLTTERIDCNETVVAGGCPFTNAEPPPGQVTGMLGTYCWYRGKYGNWLVKALKGQDPDDFSDTGDDNFYGIDEDGLYRPPKECKELADQMESDLAERGGTLEFEGEDATDEVKFAIWYLRWTADECEGMDAWF